MMALRNVPGLQGVTGEPAGTPFCGLCLESWPQPLPCSHTFCTPCLQQVYNNWALSSSPACPLPCPTCRAGLPAREDWPQQRFPVLGTVSVEEVRNSAQRRAGTGGPSLGTGGPSLGTGGPSLCPGGRHDTDLACDADTTTSTTALANTSTTATATTTTTKNSNNTAAAPERRERRCVVHPEERLRFYCRPCREPICRDCKMAAHERHAALDLGDKGAEARTLVHIVSQVSRTSLDPRLRQTLQDAEQHRAGLQDSRQRLQRTLEQRGEVLKQMVDYYVGRAVTNLQQEVDGAEQALAGHVDSMGQDLTCFLSLLEHAQHVSQTGCHSDVLDVVQAMKTFFGNGSCDLEEESYDFLDSPTPPRCPRSSGPRQARDCQLDSFFTGAWRQQLQLRSEADTTECPVCTLRYGAQLPSCPACGHGDQASPPGQAPKPDKPKKQAAMRGWCRRFRRDATNTTTTTTTTTTNNTTTTATSHPDNVTAPLQPFDVMAEAIPKFLGHVITVDQPQAEDEPTRRRGSFCGQTAEDGLLVPRSATPPARTPSASPVRQSSETRNQVKFIQLLLADWK